MVPEIVCWSELLKSAQEATKLAGESLRKTFRQLAQSEIREKPESAGLVTSADLESERICIDYLSPITPKAGWLTEESDEKKSTSNLGGRWILDPLDGTTNFAHGFPFFCISIAYEEEGLIRLGLIHAPILCKTWWAVEGGSAFEDGKVVHVSKTQALNQSLLAVGLSAHALKRDQNPLTLEKLRALAFSARGIRRSGSAALDLAYTASGVFEGYVEAGLSPWDTAAGSLILKCAGGQISTQKGEAFDLKSADLVASNKSIHEQILKVLEKTS